MVMKMLTPFSTYNDMQPTLGFKIVHLAHTPIGFENLSCNMG